MKLRVLPACLAVLAVASTASAAPIISSSTGIASPTTTLAFNEVAVPNYTPLTNQFAAYGVTFADFFYNGCAGDCVNAPPTGSDPDIGNFNNDNTSPFNAAPQFLFTSPVGGAAFQFAGNGGAYTFNARLGGALVETFTVNVNTSAINGSSGWGYYGFDGITFDELDVIAGQAFLADNLEFNGRGTTAVPEPASMTLLGSGLVSAFMARRRKKLAL
jgi:hypothetical protein